MNEKPISDRTPVSLGMVVAIVGSAIALLLAIGAAIWWAGQWTGSITARLDVIIANERQFTTDQNNLHVRVEKLERDFDHLNTSGSAKATEIEKTLQTLKEEFMIHRATAPATTTK